MQPWTKPSFRELNLSSEVGSYFEDDEPPSFAARDAARCGATSRDEPEKSAAAEALLSSAVVRLARPHERAASEAPACE